ncbi:GNAT family N-acetyltransferase [Caulobacter sp. NIBR2454]|uniref:GNAT family N-acetyltransferase n=1 Tax=Caulobacter sp. NIBR2454 TaxID=3015996 RepID=UPI0022B6275F|nr:GNAT family N-acetyltransferase [Caulobacter sp. NIBR2454]
MDIRWANSGDAETVALLHTTSWRDAYASILSPEFLAGPIEQDRLDFWASRFASGRPEQAIFLAEEQRSPVGFVCVLGDDDAMFGSLIDNLHVAPPYRGRGVGEQLLSKAASWISDASASSGIYLWVFEANVAGRRFYARLGGKEVERSVSALPSAKGQAVLRVTWDSAAALKSI